MCGGGGHRNEWRTGARLLSFRLHFLFSPCAYLFTLCASTNTPTHLCTPPSLRSHQLSILFLLPCSPTIFVHFDGVEHCRSLINNQQNSLCVCNHRPPHSSPALLSPSPSALPPIYARSTCCAALFCCLAFFRHFSSFCWVLVVVSYSCLSLSRRCPHCFWPSVRAPV